MDKLKIKSVARNASNVEDIIIRQTENTRLFLRPKLINNNDDPEACVKGAIIYQKKDDNGNYKEDKNAFDLRAVKKGEFGKVELSSEEVLTLLQKFDMLKALYKKEGLNFGETTYCITEGHLEEILIQLSKFKNRDKILEALEKLQNEDVDKLSLLVSVSKIDKILLDWEANKENSSEDFWQKKFEENSWVLSQIFSCPFIFFKAKPYLGGKSGDDRGGVFSDLLMKQQSSDNIAFIELKTPTKELTSSSPYRGNGGNGGNDENTVYSISSELSGSINQVLNQRRVFLESKKDLGDKYKGLKNPKCIVIIGDKSKLTEGKLKSFDIFRLNSLTLEIITFDELFDRIKVLKECFLN